MKVAIEPRKIEPNSGTSTLSPPDNGQVNSGMSSLDYRLRQFQQVEVEEFSEDDASDKEAEVQQHITTNIATPDADTSFEDIEDETEEGELSEETEDEETSDESQKRQKREQAIANYLGSINFMTRKVSI